MSEIEDNYYTNQIEKYLSQTIRAFSGFTVSDGVVRDGKIHTERVPCIFGTPSRVVAAVLSGDAKFRNVKLPLMAVNLSSLSLDEMRKTNRYHENELTHKRVDTGNAQNFERIEGIPLIMSIDLNIYGSSVSQLLELFEKVVLTFNPEVVIQKSNDVYDSNYITAIRLTGINNEITSPLGQQSRSAQMSLQFEIPIKLSYPHKFKSNIEEIVLTVKDDNPNTFAESEIIDVTGEDV